MQYKRAVLLSNGFTEQAHEDTMRGTGWAGVAGESKRGDFMLYYSHPSRLYPYLTPKGGQAQVHGYAAA